MTIDITFGWWLLPLVATVGAFIWAHVTANAKPGMYGGGAMFNLVIWLMALVPVLAVWLIWALLT